jgi:hypothetical protein
MWARKKAAGLRSTPYGTGSSDMAWLDAEELLHIGVGDCSALGEDLLNALGAEVELWFADLLLEEDEQCGGLYEEDFADCRTTGLRKCRP